jgi:hypothetical protein
MLRHMPLKGQVLRIFARAGRVWWMHVRALSVLSVRPPMPRIVLHQLNSHAVLTVKQTTDPCEIDVLHNLTLHMLPAHTYRWGAHGEHGSVRCHRTATMFPAGVTDLPECRAHALCQSFPVLLRLSGQDGHFFRLGNVPYTRTWVVV